MKTWAVACIAVALAAASPAPGAQPSAPINGQFDLATLDGRDVTLADYRGKWVLIYFGYTSCPDVCPTTLTELGGALRQLGPKANRVQALFIIVDPVKDTRDVMARYLKAFDPKIAGLRGDPDEIETAAKSFHVYYRARSLGGGEYAIDHSSFIYVIDPRGRFVQLLAPDSPGHKIAQELQRLIH
jgi:protein SCO1/2